MPLSTDENAIMNDEATCEGSNNIVEHSPYRVEFDAGFFHNTVSAETEGTMFKECVNKSKNTKCLLYCFQNSRSKP